MAAELGRAQRERHHWLSRMKSGEDRIAGGKTCLLFSHIAGRSGRQLAHAEIMLPRLQGQSGAEENESRREGKVGGQSQRFVGFHPGRVKATWMREYEKQASHVAPYAQSYSRWPWVAG